jgi:hypothetical protein
LRVTALDYGYLEAIEHWGSDERIVEVTARYLAHGGRRGR